MLFEASSYIATHYREKVNKLLFRLVNFFRPASLIEVGEGNGDSIRYIREARTSMTSVSLKGEDREETLRQLKVELDKMQQVDFLHIAHTSYYMEVFEMAYPYLHSGSCVVVGDNTVMFFIVCIALSAY